MAILSVEFIHRIATNGLVASLFCVCEVKCKMNNGLSSFVLIARARSQRMQEQLIHNEVYRASQLIDVR